MAEDIQEIPDSSFFVPGFKDANIYAQDTLRSILMATKSSNDLPSSGDDFDYYNTFPGFRDIMFHKRQTILSLMTSVIHSHGVRERFQGRESDEKFDLLIDTNDVILENVSNYLDEAAGVKLPEEDIVATKPSSLINTSWNKKQFNSASAQGYKLITAKNVSRPQMLFQDKVDNTNTSFIPIIKEKPNSIKPLAITFEKEGDREEYCHPYEWEIEKFKPNDEVLNSVESVFPMPVEETPLLIIKTVDQLKELCIELKSQKEFAVDLEHHSYRSFQGFTCLMQISTREKDYIVDALDLRSELHILNEVFTDPKIVKVLHGADMDVLWLQRDFGLYIVNLFDTGQASRVLHFAHYSLSYLMKHYCKIDMDKRFQLADWRVRPLPTEMIKYAREDTHYLLYVYDCLRNDLLQNGNDMKNLLISTFERSKFICAKKYQKPLFSNDKYLEVYRKCKKVLNAKQLYCMKQLYAWRDKMARENDESLPYVLPNHMLLQIAQALPREQQGILACCNPIPPLVKQQLNELHSIVMKANESSIKHLEVMDLQQKAETRKIIQNQIDLSSLVHCPHDIHHLEDRKPAHQSGSGENFLPILTKSHSSTSLLTKKPVLSVLFSKAVNTITPSRKKIPGKVVDVIGKLISPFERYKIAEDMQEKELSEKTAAEKSNADPETHVSDNDVNPSMNESTATVEDNEEEEEERIPQAQLSNFSTPLRKKSKKRKRKSKPIPDVSLTAPPCCNQEPLRKKSKTPEAATRDTTFTPYDYNQADLGSFSGKKRSGEKFNKEKNHYQTPRPYFGKKRKNSKQATISKDSTKDRNANWPKRK